MNGLVRCACGWHELLAGSKYLGYGGVKHSAASCTDARGVVVPPRITEWPPVSLPSPVPSPRLIDATLEQFEAAITRAIIAALTVELTPTKSAREALGAWNDSLRGADDRIAGPEVRS